MRENAQNKENTVTIEEFNSIPCTCPACSGITFDEATKLWRKEHRPQPQEDVVWKALLALRDACDLRSELGTDILFHVLFEACKRLNHPNYQHIVLEEGDEPFDLTIALADTIIEVMEEWGPVQRFSHPEKAWLLEWEREIAEQKRLSA
jgi:hypothetical protein